MIVNPTMCATCGGRVVSGPRAAVGGVWCECTPPPPPDPRNRPMTISVMTRPCDHHPNLLRAVGLCHLIGATRW